MAEVLRLKAELAEVEVVLEPKDEDGEEKKFILRELIGKQRNKYMNKMTDRIRISPQGKVLGMKNFDGMQADLLSKCLYNDQDELVSVEEIEELPASTQQALFQKAQELSGLNQEQDEDEKN